MKRRSKSEFLNSLGYKRKSQRAGSTSTLPPITDISLAMLAFHRFTSAYHPASDMLSDAA